jgi:hypothetical protein
MRFLRRLEQNLGRFAVPQVTIAIIAVQVLAYALIVSQPNPQKELAVLDRLLLYADKVLEGEVWRLATFVAVPPVIGKSMLGPIWAFLAWYVFYLLGTTLEQYWGAFRYNLYLLVGYVATVAAAFLTPHVPATNFYYLESVFLAFAFLFPDFQFLLFFILPVKVKWLALIAWVQYGLLFAFGGFAERVMILAAIANFLLFFWREILDRVQTGRRRMARQAAHIVSAKEPAFRHRCAVCGITEKTNPDEDFRYCSKCGGQLAYCSQHLRNHEHVTASQEAT